MAFMEWNDSYTLGVCEVDEQHRHLFELVNEMYDCLVRGEEQSATGKILDKLIDYTVDHFATEENLFAEQQYPKLEEHKEEHDKLIKIALDLQEKLREKSITISFDVLDFLSDWLKDHTTTSDLEYAKFAHSKE